MPLGDHLKTGPVRVEKAADVEKAEANRAILFANAWSQQLSSRQLPVNQCHDCPAKQIPANRVGRSRRLNAV